MLSCMPVLHSFSLPKNILWRCNIKKVGKEKSWNKMNMVAHAYDPRIQKVKHEDHHAFEASYIAGSRPSWAAE